MENSKNTIIISLVSDISFKSLIVTQGVKYYVEVSACNMAGLCSKSTSDGVILDTTPPVVGKVADGTKDEDIHFQASRFVF